MACYQAKTCLGWRVVLNGKWKRPVVSVGNPSVPGSLSTSKLSRFWGPLPTPTQKRRFAQVSRPPPQPMRPVRVAPIRQEQTYPPTEPWGRAIQVTQPVYEYVVSHTREPEVLTKLREETSTRVGSVMQVSPEQGQFLAMLVKLMGAERCLEVGVFTGYSAISVALALPEHGRLVGLDRCQESVEVAQRYFELAGVAHKIDVRLGLAMESLEEMLANGEANRYDFAFLDADKKLYKDYYETLLQLVRPGGLVVVDNVLWRGAVADPTVTEARTESLREFNDMLVQDARIDVSMVSIGDGMTLCWKR